MAGWFFKRKSADNGDRIISLQAANHYTPTQVSGDTVDHPSISTLPTLGKLLTVQKDEKFLLPNNQLVQWLLVERQNSSDQLSSYNADISETSSGISDIDAEQPCWGFIPKKCLTDESIRSIESKCSICAKYNEVTFIY